MDVMIIDPTWEAITPRKTAELERNDRIRGRLFLTA